MKLEIDLGKDSPEELSAALEMISKVLSSRGQSYSTYGQSHNTGHAQPPQQSAPTPTTDLFSMFNTEPQSVPQSQPIVGGITAPIQLNNQPPNTPKKDEFVMKLLPYD